MQYAREICTLTKIRNITICGCVNKPKSLLVEENIYLRTIHSISATLSFYSQLFYASAIVKWQSMLLYSFILLLVLDEELVTF